MHKYEVHIEHITEYHVQVEAEGTVSAMTKVENMDIDELKEWLVGDDISVTGAYEIE